MFIRQWAVAIHVLLMVSATYAAPRRFSDIEYASTNGLSLRFDACIPSGEAPFPAAILVHGGAWVRGDRRVEVAPLFQPLTDAGIAWFSISYRFATSPLEFGTAIDDVEAAIRYVKSHASEYKIDPDRIALVGESAGGQLAAMAALNAPPGAVKAVVALYTPTDLVALATNSSLVPPAIQQAIDGTPWKALILGRLAQLSPIEHVRPDMPPFLLIHGTADPLVPFQQSTKMCERMKTVGASCELYPVPNAGHGIRWWESAVYSAPYKKRLVDWLKAHLGGE
jgi:acetyl esterase/lipase